MCEHLHMYQYVAVCVCSCMRVSIYNKCLAVGGPIPLAPYLSVWIDACMREVSVTPRGSVQVGVDEYTLRQEFLCKTR